jgi:hypothetical protein
MNVESIDYEYKNGVLVQLDDNDKVHLAYSIDRMKQEIAAGNFPCGDFLTAIELTERILDENER